MQELVLFPSPELERRQPFHSGNHQRYHSQQTYQQRLIVTAQSPRHFQSQEHLTPQDKLSITHTVFLSPTDPDRAKPAVGVGLIAAQGDQVYEPHTPQTEKLAFFRQQGRADIYNIDMGSSTALMVINVYGWQGAANNTNSRKRTDELIEAAQQEFDTARYTLGGCKAPQVFQDHQGHSAFSTKATEQNQFKKRYTRSYNTSGDPDKPTLTDGRMTSATLGREPPTTKNWNTHTNKTTQTRLLGSL